MTQKGVGVARVVSTKWSKALAVFQLGNNTSFKSPLECPEDVRYPLIMSNLNREGEYAIAGKLTV